jgi:cell division protein FtsB
MFLIVAKYLIPKGYRGMAVFPFVLMKYDLDKANMIFVNHEKIHLKQQKEMLILPFFIWYFLEYLFRLIQYKNKDLAYRNISFEREAYAKETDLDYLKNRSFFQFLNYIKLK